MSITVKLIHSTNYVYDRKINLSPHVIRLRPAPHTKTKIQSYSLNIFPEKKFVNWQQDPFSNWQARIVFPEKTDRLTVTTELLAEISVYNPFDFFTEPYAESFPFAYEGALKHELTPYLKVAETGKEIESFIEQFDLSQRKITDFLVQLNRYVADYVKYVIRLEPGVQTCKETLVQRSGSCRDSAYLLVQVLRTLGLAARFVSGYLIQLKPDNESDLISGKPFDDFTDLHAWAEVFIPGAGWIGLDATSGLLASEGHIPLAATPEPENASAISGFSDPCETKFTFEMKVQRIHESPRVTFPYPQKTWQGILEFSKQVQARLDESDMRLTIGGEPTFVSATDRESPQWNFEAAGEEKHTLALQLHEKIRNQFTRHAITMHTQGKWYPGEILPRWSIGCFWRSDGRPLWHNHELLSGKAQKGIDLNQALNFSQSLLKALKLPAHCAQIAYEDGLAQMLAEGRLPPNVRTDEIQDVFNKVERERILRIADEDISHGSAIVIPLKYDEAKAKFISCIWKLRRTKIFLLAGDSPAGLRLPLASISDFFEPGSTQPADTTNLRKKKADSLQAGEMQTAGTPINTAICLEPGEGFLTVFLPPFESIEGFLLLLHHIEKICESQNIYIRLEGYEPPPHKSVSFYRITPDPGVIEVNLHPSSTVANLLHKTESLYQMANDCGLTSDRYMLDGRPSATGGGNHITLGAASVEDSPFLRRHDLLPSVISYWQNHPSLSYLFSGLFIGPTSQAPRIDEARDGSLYEAEIALKELRNKKGAPPWIVDRIMRNILVDITGNTHRTEISIDKLYAPGSYIGRLGLVEFRGFEMPPHFQMSVAQQLLLLSLMLKFWAKPYEHPLIPHGSDLRDKYMLPYFIWQDFLAVLSDLKKCKLDIIEEFFQPFFDFRFPLYGKLEFRNTSLELRMALEPWNVLGEETLAVGVSRAVDNSTERLQVLLRNFDHDRYVLACNGYRVPLFATSDGHSVAGVLFKAWAPHYSLHPSIPVHSPLNFSFYDKANESYVAGCSYHVSHPGGLAYDTFPVNSYEAESRRLSRFHENAVYPDQPPRNVANAWYKHTLDLRTT